MSAATRVSEPERLEAIDLCAKLAPLAGCCLHCVIDDHNTKDAFLRAYTDEDVKHPDCRRLLSLLRKMKRTQRDKVASLGYGKALRR